MSVCIFCVLPVCVQGSLYLQVEEDEIGEEDVGRVEPEHSAEEEEEEDEEIDVNSEHEEDEDAAINSDDQMWNSDKSDR